MLDFKTFRQLNEVRIFGDDVTKESPLLDDQTIRCYHGFNDMRSALKAVTKGLSGQEKAKRIYSYEANNNPKGLFVTTQFKKAKDFSGGDKLAVVIEFQCKVKDLEAPVWPGGSYTVQGQLAQYFTGDADRDLARLQARDVAKNNTVRSIRDSDRPELALSLMASYENQALFIGHLDPNMIRAVWVRKARKDSGYQITTDAFTRYSRQDFLKTFSKDIEAPKKDHRVFRPNEDFDGDVFLERLLASHKGNTRESLIDAIKGVSDDQLLIYLWPKQVSGAIKWKASL